MPSYGEAPDIDEFDGCGRIGFVMKCAVCNCNHPIAVVTPCVRVEGRVGDIDALREGLVRRGHRWRV
jgi:hypothetical protein